MSPYLMFAFLAFLAVLQMTLVPHAALGVARPELILLASSSWALLRGAQPAVAWAIVGGLLLDALSAWPIGTYTLPLVAATLVVASGRGIAFSAHVVVPGVMMAIGTVVYALVQYGIIAGIGEADLALESGLLTRLFLPMVALQLLWLPVLYFPLRWMANRTGRPRMEWDR